VDAVKKEVIKRRTLTSVSLKRNIKCKEIYYTNMCLAQPCQEFCSNDKFKILENFVNNEYFLANVYKQIFINQDEYTQE